MVRVTVLDASNHAVEGVPNNKSKGEKNVVEPSMNSAQRRKLADISNLQNQKKPMIQGATVVSSKDYVERLQKENMTLMKVLMERNKIIELSGGELQKLRINLQKVQEQNLQLAQANTHMLAEINTNKDRLKSLQHELGCKNGLLMAKKIQLEEQTLPSTHHASEDKADANAPDGAYASNGMNPKNDKRKQQSRIKSSESSSAKSLQINENANKKRRISGRRNTANSEVIDVIGRPAETSPTEDNIDNKQLVSDGDNTDKKKLVPDAGNRINENIHSRSTGIELQEIRQTETKETARVSLRRRSARITSQDSKPSEIFNQSYENIETTKKRRVSSRRQSAIFDFQELEVTENLNGLHDDQETSGNPGAGSALRETRQTEKLHEVTDAKEINKETARVSARRCSARITSQDPKPSEIFNQSYENIEKTKKRRVSSRRQSAIFGFEELEVTENLNGLHDDQETSGNPGCSASTESIESKPEAVKPDENIDETKETTKKNSFALRRESTKSKPERGKPGDNKDRSSQACLNNNETVDESHQKPSLTSMEEHEKESKKKVESKEAEEMMRRTSVGGRPLRQAAGKIQSYKEISLKEKMRR